MEPQKIFKLLEDIKAGLIEPAEALAKLKELPFEDLGFAKVDHHRALRTGLPEVIYAPGKTPEQIVKIAGKIQQKGVPVLITRTDENIYQKIKEQFQSATYNSDARIIRIATEQEQQHQDGSILVISAGTSDIPVAEEAAMTVETIGYQVTRIYDVGVAGIHRLLAHQQALAKAEVIIVVAGMEGALASVVGGLVDCPVIAVPTSVGYGASFGGVSALLSMLNSCVPGVTVVNIDNGFGAACAANLILKTRKADK
jgi:NCAIR mutase (PurE)-related protein